MKKPDKDRYNTSGKYAKRKYKLKKKAEKKYNRGNRTGQNQRYYAARRLAYKAHKFVERAIIKGILIRPRSCSICDIVTEQPVYAHHEDYNKPADVIWVCWRCHNSLHSKGGEIIEKKAD